MILYPGPKKNGFSGNPKGETLQEIPPPLWPGHSSAGYLRFMTSITSFATSRCTETGKPARWSPRKWRQVFKGWDIPVNSGKKSLIQSRNGDATSTFLLETPQKNTYCIRYVLQTKCRNESNTVKYRIRSTWYVFYV